MEQINLNEPANPAPVDPPSKSLERDWCQHYKKLIQDTIKKVANLMNADNWTPIIVEQRIQLLTLGVSYNHYSYKWIASIEARAERFLFVMMDQNPQTRKKWDTSPAIKEITELETFETSEGRIKVVNTTVGPENVHPVWDRCFFGISWCKFNRDTQTYTFVFHTTSSHRARLPPPNTVQVCGFVGGYLRIMEKGTCELHMVAYINPGDSLMTAFVHACHGAMVERIKLYEHVAKNWNKFYG
jgi:hypothetical protein